MIPCQLFNMNVITANNTQSVFTTTSGEILKKWFVSITFRLKNPFSASMTPFSRQPRRLIVPCRASGFSWRKPLPIWTGGKQQSRVRVPPEEWAIRSCLQLSTIVCSLAPAADFDYFRDWRRERRRIAEAQYNLAVILIICLLVDTFCLLGIEAYL